MSGAARRSGYAAVLSAYESSRDLRAAVREVDERWTELHWIHGDLTVSNVQSRSDPRCGSASSVSMTPVWEIRRGTWPRLST